MERTFIMTHAPSASLMSFMALLEPSCSPPSNVLTSQQCGNSLLQQKAIASLGVIRPIQNRLIYALLNHMIGIVWSAVSQSTLEALPRYFLISMRIQSVNCSGLWLKSQSDEYPEFAKKAGTLFQTTKIVFARVLAIVAAYIMAFYNNR